MVNRTKIEWVKNPDGSAGYTWNPITGCLNHTDGLCKGGGFPCYAYKLANGRLKPLYLANKELAPVHYGTYKRFDGELSQTVVTRAFADPFYPRFWEERLRQGIFDLGSKPKGIFVCDMGELFGDSIPDMWVKKILAVCGAHPEHRFYLLTKQPQNLIKFSPFPDNCFVGVTVTSSALGSLYEAEYHLKQITSKVKFLSLEPLLNWEKPCGAVIERGASDGWLNWLIIGAQTKPYKPPKIEWVREIVEAADHARVPVFLKDNLLELVNYQSPETDFAFNKDGQYRQEMPS